MKAAKGEGKAGLEGSSSNVLLKTPSLNETSIYTEQAVLHQLIIIPSIMKTLQMQEMYYT